MNVNSLPKSPRSMRIPTVLVDVDRLYGLIIRDLLVCLIKYQVFCDSDGVCLLASGAAISSLPYLSLTL